METGGGGAHRPQAARHAARNSGLCVGCRAGGRRGRRSVAGEKTVRIHGETIPVHASVEHIESMSAHADANEIMHWLGGFTHAPRNTFIVHGEPAAMETLSARIGSTLAWKTTMPEHRQTIALD